MGEDGPIEAEKIKSFLWSAHGPRQGCCEHQQPGAGARKPLCTTPTAAATGKQRARVLGTLASSRVQRRAQTGVVRRGGRGESAARDEWLLLVSHFRGLGSRRVGDDLNGQPPVAATLLLLLTFSRSASNQRRAAPDPPTPAPTIHHPPPNARTQPAFKHRAPPAGPFRDLQPLARTTTTRICAPLLLLSSPVLLPPARVCTLFGLPARAHAASPQHSRRRPGAPPSDSYRRRAPLGPPARRRHPGPVT